MLSKPSLNFVQYWALGYWLVMDRRTQRDDKRAELELQTFNLDFDRWVDVYRDSKFGSSTIQTYTQQAGDYGLAFGGEEELPTTIDDLHSLDDWVDSMDRPRRMNGGNIQSDYDVSSVLGYVAPGDKGRRV